MLVKTITYTDYDGTERTETFYFNLNEAEISRMHLSIEGGMKAYINKIVNAKSNVEIIKFFDKILEASFGIKSDDGRRLIKGPEVFKAFSETEAYNVLYMELLGNGGKNAAKFLEAIIPDTTKNTPEIKTILNA